MPVPAVILRVEAPSTVPLKVISPMPAPEFKLDGAVKAICPAKEIASLVVVIDPPKETDPAPVCVKEPSRLKGLPIVKRPVFVRATDPPPVVVTSLLNVNAFPERLILVVAMGPLNRASPEIVVRAC